MGFIKEFNDVILKKKQNNDFRRTYKDLIKKPEIDSIITNMPTNLTQLEKAYYIYLELGKILTEDTEFVFGNYNTKTKNYYHNIDENYIGICKSISELYVAILTDRRIGIDAEVIRQHPEREMSHIDTILKIDGKIYIANLIIDLYNIKSSRRTRGFGMDLYEEINHPIMQFENEMYIKMLEEKYGEIYFADDDVLLEMDKKLKYSLFMPEFMEDSRRGFYADDTIEIIKYELRDEKKFKEYVLKGKDVPKEEYLKYKLDFIFENKNRFAERTGNSGYLENIRYYNKLFKKFLTEDEYSKIQIYAATVNDDLRNILAIIKVKQGPGKNNLYYIYDKEQDKFEEKTQMEMKSIIEKLEKSSFKIVGNLDRREKEELEELEL